VNRDDVEVVEGGGRARFLGESAEAVRDRGEGLGQELDGDVAVEVEVPHADHGWHGAVRLS